MKWTKDFNDFLMEIIFESNQKGHGVTELPFIIGMRLRNILEEIVIQ